MGVQDRALKLHPAHHISLSLSLSSFLPEIKKKSRLQINNNNDKDYNGVFGKLPSHQMAVAIMCLIGKEIREIHFGHRALPYILCAYKYIQCL